jgi:hypothetical protein
MANIREAFKKKNCEPCLPSFSGGVTVGEIVQFTETGQILVQYPGNSQSPIPARLTSSAKEKLQHALCVGREVLLMFVDNDPECPVIIDTMCPVSGAFDAESGTGFDERLSEEVTIDRRRIVFEAEEEIVLRCGNASITLSKTGKVYIKGSYLVSRSSGTNSIKGSSVRIN